MKQVRGTVQADILKEDQAQNTCIFSLEFALKMMGDIQELFCRYAVKNYYSVSISGYHIAEAGANPISQMAFTEKWKTDVSTFGGHAYDGLMIAVDAIKRAGSTDKAKVRDAIEATKGYIGTGGVVNMSATDHMGLDLSAFRMLEIKNGDWTIAP